MKTLKDKKSVFIACFLFIFVFQIIGTSLIIIGSLQNNKNVIYVGLGVVIFNVIVGVILLLIILYKFLITYSKDKGDK